MKSVRRIDPCQLCLFDQQLDAPHLEAPQPVRPATQTQRKRAGAPAIHSARVAPERLNCDSTLADVLAALEADPQPDTRRKDTKSALRRMGRMLGQPLVDLPADPARLRPLLAKAAPTSASMSRACWSRVRSLVHAALSDAGIDAMPGRDVVARAPAWISLLEELPTWTLRLQLSAFVSHCSRLGLEPNEVSLETFATFRAALETRNRKREPAEAYRATVACWNKAVASAPG